MRNRLLKVAACLVLLGCAVVFMKAWQIDNDLKRQLKEHEVRKSAHTLLMKLLEFEVDDTFADPKLSAVEEMKSMIDRFHGYHAMAFTPKDHFDVSNVFHEASQRILKRGKKDVKAAEDELAKEMTKASGPTSKT